MPKFVIVTTGDLPEAYFLAAALESRDQRLAIVNITGRPAVGRARILARLRRTRGTRYVVDLLLARVLNLLVHRLGPPGVGAFPEIDARLVRDLRARHPHLDCVDPHAPDVLAFVDRFAPEYMLLAGCQRLEPKLYGLARTAALNRHLGLLPEYRGSDCAVWALAAGRPECAGYSIHVVAERVDAGDIVLARPVPVRQEPTLPEYLRRLRREASEAFVEVLTQAIAGAPLARVQQNGTGRYFPQAGWSTQRRARRVYARVVAQNSREASRAPSASADIFAQATPGSTAACPTQVPKPQSVPAMTRSRPTSRA
jgi:folate-dependent phosphoribosylglycinamide formyltransferase PurN